MHFDEHYILNSTNVNALKAGNMFLYSTMIQRRNL